MLMPRLLETITMTLDEALQDAQFIVFEPRSCCRFYGRKPELGSHSGMFHVHIRRLRSLVAVEEVLVLLRFGFGICWAALIVLVLCRVLGLSFSWSGSCGLRSKSPGRVLGAASTRPGEGRAAAPQRSRSPDGMARVKWEDVRMLWSGRRRRAEMRRNYLDRLRDEVARLQLAAARLGELETALDNRASVVVVAGGIVIAAGANQAWALSAQLSVLGSACAAVAMLLAVLSLALRSQDRDTIELYRFMDWDGESSLGAESHVMREAIPRAIERIRNRRRLLNGAFAVFLTSALILAVNVTIPGI